MNVIIDLRVKISIVLVCVVVSLGSIAPLFLLANHGPASEVRIALLFIIFAILPFFIGWLAPALWWMGWLAWLAPEIIFIFLWRPVPYGSISQMILRYFYYLLPLFFSVLFSYLGRSFRIR